MTENMLQNYCQTVGTPTGPGPIKSGPLINNPSTPLPSAKEKAQLLQVSYFYCDLFLYKKYVMIYGANGFEGVKF